MSKPDFDLDTALSGIPDVFRKRIIEHFLTLKHRHTMSVYDSSNHDAIGLSAGKFCESVVRHLQEKLLGTYTPFGTHISNFADTVRSLVSSPSTAGCESERVIIPRALLLLYTLRGKRGVGHVGGDVDANQMDIDVMASVVTWIVCELVRLYHSVSLEEAQALVNSLNTRTIPQVWEVLGKKRVLEAGYTTKQKVLVLAYSVPDEGVLVEDLFEWCEYSNLSMFKRIVLAPLHNEKLIEYNQELEAIVLSPLGIQEAEQLISKSS